ncbi:MAG: hypothetical protein J6O50_14165 [Ruminiclostridium sp.]|nr:hypothetical protein [Ruminiclostridium sp.]
MSNITPGMTCRNCGAPITSEICQYCGCSTGLDTYSADMQYPTLECKEATINFWTVAFPLVFALSFGIGGSVIPFAVFSDMAAGVDNNTPQERIMVLLFCIPFLAIGIAAAVIAIKPVIRYFIIKSKGKHIDAVVYGYADDHVIMNGRPAQVVKLLIDTPIGKRFIMYQLGNTDQPYGINTTIGLVVYKNYFMIEKNKDVIHW